MEAKEYIEKRIQNLKISNSTFKRLSLLLLIVGIGIIIIALLNIIPQQFSNDFAEYGFGILNLLIPLYLNDQVAKRKDKILDLELLKNKLSDENFNQELYKKVLENL